MMNPKVKADRKVRRLRRKAEKWYRRATSSHFAGDARGARVMGRRAAAALNEADAAFAAAYGGGFRWEHHPSYS